MCDAVNSWLMRHRMLRMSFQPSAYEIKKNNILSIYETALRGRIIPAAPYVYNSHQADIRQIPELKAIICDINFFDIAKLVASSFYISPTHDIIRLADALSFLSYNTRPTQPHYAFFYGCQWRRTNPISRRW